MAACKTNLSERLVIPIPLLAWVAEQAEKQKMSVCVFANVVFNATLAVCGI